MSGFSNAPRYLHVTNDVTIALADQKIRDPDDRAIAACERDGDEKDRLIDNGNTRVNSLQRAPLPLFEQSLTKVRHRAEDSEMRFLMPLAKPADNLLKKTGLRRRDTMVMQIEAQVAFRRPVGTVKIAPREYHCASPTAHRDAERL